jgi:hypothetical protein
METQIQKMISDIDSSLAPGQSSTHYALDARDDTITLEEIEACLEELEAAIEHEVLSVENLTALYSQYLITMERVDQYREELEAEDDEGGVEELNERVKPLEECGETLVEMFREMGFLAPTEVGEDPVPIVEDEEADDEAE